MFLVRSTRRCCKAVSLLIGYSGKKQTWLIRRGAGSAKLAERFSATLAQKKLYMPGKSM